MPALLRREYATCARRGSRPSLRCCSRRMVAIEMSRDGMRHPETPTRRQRRHLTHQLHRRARRAARRCDHRTRRTTLPSANSTRSEGPIASRCIRFASPRARGSFARARRSCCRATKWAGCPPPVRRSGAFAHSRVERGRTPSRLAMGSYFSPPMGASCCAFSRRPRPCRCSRCDRACARARPQLNADRLAHAPNGGPSYAIWRRQRKLLPN